MSEVIRLLPDHIANQIAAGEVIQRPASVLKELTENAIDSGATQIDVWIKDAGKTLIQVTDNGCGMSEIDSRMAFERHATSKLATADDLFKLKTKGFRGEALAAISAIAHVELKTRQENSEWGTSICIEGSKVIEQNPVTCKIGSSFMVKNLFFNVPARRNFLKSDSVEFKHVEDEFMRVVLAHLNIKFTLTHNDQVVYHLEAANLRKRIVDIFGRLYNDRIIPISEKTDLVQIEGFVGKPEFSKKTRGEQYFFVNDRFFKDSYFNHALTQAYDNLLASKTFPCYFIFLQVNPQVIDVNIHPTKTEIKFENDREIYAILKSAVRQSLGKFNISPSLDFERESSFDLPWEMNNKPVVEPVIQVNTDYNPFNSSSGKSVSNGNSSAIRQSGFGEKEISKADWEAFYKLDEVKASGDNQEDVQLHFSDEAEQQHRFIFHKNYLISPVKSGLMLVHSRRAKERIIYDEIMASFMLTPVSSQQLLFPVNSEMSPALKAMWEQNSKTIQRLGFNWESAEEGLSFKGLPSYLEQEQAQECIASISHKLEIEQFDQGELAHEFILSIARSASAQSSKWNDEAANQLIGQLFKCPEHQYSPSGKLIIKTLSTDELTQQF